MSYYGGACPWDMIKKMPINIYLMLWEGMVFNSREMSEEGRKINKSEDLAIEAKYGIIHNSNLDNFQ